MSDSDIIRNNLELQLAGGCEALRRMVASVWGRMSRMMKLPPGEVLTTGAPPGVGAGFKPPKFLKAGNVVEVSIEGVGTLRNPVEDEA